VPLTATTVFQNSSYLSFSTHPPLPYYDGTWSGIVQTPRPHAEKRSSFTRTPLLLSHTHAHKYKSVVTTRFIKSISYSLPQGAHATLISVRSLACFGRFGRAPGLKPGLAHLIRTASCGLASSSNRNRIYISRSMVLYPIPLLHHIVQLLAFSPHFSLPALITIAHVLHPGRSSCHRPFELPNPSIISFSRPEPWLSYDTFFF